MSPLRLSTAAKVIGEVPSALRLFFYLHDVHFIIEETIYFGRTQPWHEIMERAYWKCALETVLSVWSTFCMHVAWCRSPHRSQISSHNEPKESKRLVYLFSLPSVWLLGKHSEETMYTSAQVWPLKPDCFNLNSGWLSSFWPLTTLV